MKKYAFVRDNVVVSVDVCSEESYLYQSPLFQNIIDIDNAIPEPQVGWVLEGSALLPPAGFTRKDILKTRYLNRAAEKNEIIAEMATKNVLRLEAGTWSEMDLLSLSSDAQLNEILSNINDALAFEIAYAKVDSITNPLITSEIKEEWKSMLVNYFY
jgi:hypothetical protein